MNVSSAASKQTQRYTDRLEAVKRVKEPKKTEIKDAYRVAYPEQQRKKDVVLPKIRWIRDEGPTALSTHTVESISSLT